MCSRILGLCQAKIVAAELWRKHSENYKSHQARYPNPKSKYKARRMSAGLDQPLNPADNMFSVPPAEFLKYNQDTTLIYQRTDTIKASEPASVMRFIKNTLGGCDESRDSLLGNCLSTGLTDGDVLGVNDVKKINQEGGTETSEISMVRIKEEIPFTLNNHEDAEATSALDESVRMAYPVEPYRAHQQFLPPPVRDNYVSSLHYYGSSAAATDTASVASQIKKNISGGRNNDYRKSERGLSYLFPSLIDQQLSLLDKVRITVLRHKNNYFLGWTEDQLKRVDPLVRPKMPVTRELYKEYCHRNAMKYDSNLQFAMESQTSWAVEFRDRLVKPPNEGGFHSLCEVKQEAGRLWKEFSGRYKMHNVVKAQMDMNNEQVKTPALLVERSESMCSSNFDDTNDFRSTTSSPGPRLDRITSPIRKFISRSANSSPTHGCEEPMLRYQTLDFPPDLHGSRKRKQSNDSGCASLPSPTNGAEDTDIYKHNFAPRHIAVTGETVPYGITPVKAGFAFQDSIPHDGDLHSKFSRLERPTHSTASEVTNSMLFAPLPPELSVVNQLLIWLQRHRNNYFIGWSQAQLDKLNPFLRPLYVVTPEVLKSHVSPTMFAMFDKVEEVIASASIWAKNYQDKLSLPTEKGGFRTIEEALTDAMDIWTTHCQPKISPPQGKDVQNPGFLKLRDMFRAKSSLQNHDLVNPTAEQVDPNNTLEGLLHTKPVSRADTCESRSNLSVLHGTEIPPADDTVLDLSKKNSAINSSEITSQNTVATDTSGLKAGLVTNLWNCRKQMQEVCRDSVASSWQDRLQPHLGLLHEKLGKNYQLPTSVSDCMVDLMLVLLHESLTDA